MNTTNSKQFHCVHLQVQHVQQVPQVQQVQHVQLAQIPMQTMQQTQQQQEATQAVQTLAEVAAATQGGETTVTSLPQGANQVTVDMNTSEAAAQAVATLAEATLADGSQIMLSAGDTQTITGVQQDGTTQSK